MESLPVLDIDEFFIVEPIACDPLELPKYPPSKEFDAKKLMDVEAGRRREAIKKRNNHEFGREVPKHSKGMPHLEANAESQNRLSRGRPGDYFCHYRWKRAGRRPCRSFLEWSPEIFLSTLAAGELVVHT
ncbi:putative serine/threonine-protein kinase [Platanthera guangdongensis]|uniref:Serine/threonine-protein kinase n=1 Tax=Platanthera guangdongensis TaxID=2320717 RepID=A0ABR2MTQ3_9ASPA